MGRPPDYSRECLILLETISGPFLELEGGQGTRRASVLESYDSVGVDSSYQVTFGSTRSLHGTEISMAPAIACFRKFDGVRR